MTNLSSVTETPGHPDPLACLHYWVIEPASGPLSPGVCQICGEDREFKNYVGNHAWDDYNLVSRSGPDGLTTVTREVDGHGTSGENDAE